MVAHAQYQLSCQALCMTLMFSFPLWRAYRSNFIEGALHATKPGRWRHPSYSADGSWVPGSLEKPVIRGRGICGQCKCCFNHATQVKQVHQSNRVSSKEETQNLKVQTKPRQGQSALRKKGGAAYAQRDGRLAGWNLVGKMNTRDTPKPFEPSGNPLVLSYPPDLTVEVTTLVLMSPESTLLALKIRLTPTLQPSSLHVACLTAFTLIPFSPHHFKHSSLPAPQSIVSGFWLTLPQAAGSSTFPNTIQFQSLTIVQVSTGSQGSSSTVATLWGQERGGRSHWGFHTCFQGPMLY